MSKDFRHEVFELCKVLQKKQLAKEVGTVMYNLSVTTESEKCDEIRRNVHGDLACIAQHSNTEFHGFLFIDENINKIDIPKFFQAEHLTPEERTLIERGHKTLTRFIDLCLSDIADKSHLVAEAMNPYFLYKEVTCSQKAESLLADTELLPAVTAFKNGAVYKALMDANFTMVFEKTDVNAMRSLVGSLQKEIDNSLGGNATKDLSDFSLKLADEPKDVAEIMFAFSILMVALKESLKLSCQLLYRAICGIELTVLNNDNIINIEKRTSNVISEFFKVFVQGLPIDYTNSEMGSILLIDCDLPYERHIHKFGMVIAETMNLSGEFGQTTKYSFVTVDKELILIHQLTERILHRGLPKIIKG